MDISTRDVMRSVTPPRSPAPLHQVRAFNRADKGSAFNVQHFPPPLCSPLFPVTVVCQSATMESDSDILAALRLQDVTVSDPIPLIRQMEV